jgi:hypothetical protein
MDRKRRNIPAKIKATGQRYFKSTPVVAINTKPINSKIPAGILLTHFLQVGILPAQGQVYL